MVSIEPIQDYFFKICAPKNTKNVAPLLRRQSPEGDGAPCDVSALPVSGALPGTGNAELSQPGDARAAGAEASLRPQERQCKFCFRFIERLVVVTQSPSFLFSVETHMKGRSHKNHENRQLFFSTLVILRGGFMSGAAAFITLGGMGVSTPVILSERIRFSSCGCELRFTPVSKKHFFYSPGGLQTQDPAET